MTKQHEITGLGPKRPDGSMLIFTTLSHPFNVSAAWLEAQPKQPDVGDTVEVADNGDLSLLISEAPAETIAIIPADATVQKKSHGPAESGNGSGASPFKQFASKPTVVSAAEITSVVEAGGAGELAFVFADGSQKTALPGMTSRMLPTVGDYWVIASQEGSAYEYLNPKAVFEAKYSLVE